MNENCRNPKVRNEIKKRLESELSMSDVPVHRKFELESALCEISCYEQDRLITVKTSGKTR